MAAKDIAFAMEKEELEGPRPKQELRIEAGGTVEGVSRLARM